MGDIPKELYVIHFTAHDIPVNITRNNVIRYQKKDNIGQVQVTDIYSADEADVETTYGPLHVTIGKDASDELEIALRIALHALDLKHTFMNLDVIGCYQRLVLLEPGDEHKIAMVDINHMRDLIQTRYDAFKAAACSLFDDVCRLQLESRESAAQ